MLIALIIGAVLLAGCVSAPVDAETQHWTCRSEVYELVWQNSALFARTSGGIFKIENGRVIQVENLPAVPRRHEVPVSGDGAFLSATVMHQGKTLASYWGGKSIFAYEGGELTRMFDRPPAEGDYSMASGNEALYIGTNRGLYRREADVWRVVDLGGELPFARIHGIAKIGNEFIIGGPDGLAIGTPRKWNFVSREAVRQIAKVGSDAWILYGSGALDKLASDGKLHSDVLYGAAKRPWTSAVGVSADGLLLGGQGGWSIKGGAFVETYPPEMAGEVVTAIANHHGILYAGTQGKGLAAISKGKITWINPGNGLADTWITALVSFRDKFYAATATAGLYEIAVTKTRKIPTPSNKLRHLAVFNGSLVIGAIDGAWKQVGAGWTKMNTKALETTCLSVIDKKLWIGTPSGIFIESTA